MSGRGMSDFGGKAGKGAVKKRKRHMQPDTEAEEPQPDAGQPAPAKATRKTEQDEKDNELYILRTDKTRLKMIIDEDEKTIEGLREQLAAANAELECHKGNKHTLAECTDKQLDSYRQDAWNALRSVSEAQAHRVVAKCEKECKESEREQDERMAQCECIICHNPFEDAVIIACSHTFCRNCLQTWLRDHDTCPACRAPTSTQAMISNLAVRGMMATRQDFQLQRDLDIAAGMTAIIASMQTSYAKLCEAFRRLKT